MRLSLADVLTPTLCDKQELTLLSQTHGPRMEFAIACSILAALRLPENRCTWNFNGEAQIVVDTAEFPADSGAIIRFKATIPGSLPWSLKAGERCSRPSLLAVP